MLSQFQDDINTIFNAGEMTTLITVKRKTNVSPFDIPAISEGVSQLSLLGINKIDNRNLFENGKDVRIRREDYSNPAKGDIFVIDGKEYSVRDWATEEPFLYRISLQADIRPKK